MEERTFVRHAPLLALGAVLALAGVACGGGEQRAETPSPAETDRSADEMGLASEQGAGGEEAAPESPPSPPPVLVVVGDHMPFEGPMPTLRIDEPRPNQLIRSGPVRVRATLTNWPLQPDPGQHVHLILDDEPYIAIRDLSQPLDLNALVQQHLGHELAEGTHVLRMFPSRGHHESVKDPGAFAMVVFHYRSRTEGFEIDPTAPLLTYSRPKGCNPVGQRVLLDFFLTNVQLAPDGYRVHWNLDGQEGDITEWKPHWIENLSEGSHSLTLELRGPDGTPVPGRFNSSTRSFTVASSCPG